MRTITLAELLHIRLKELKESINKNDESKDSTCMGNTMKATREMMKTMRLWSPELSKEYDEIIEKNSFNILTVEEAWFNKHEPYISEKLVLIGNKTIIKPNSMRF